MGLLQFPLTNYSIIKETLETTADIQTKLVIFHSVS